MILIGNTCATSYMYKYHYKEEFNNPFNYCYICIEDFKILIEEYRNQLNECYDIDLSWTYEKKIVRHNYNYEKLISCVLGKLIKFNYNHGSSKDSITDYRKRVNKWIKRWKKIKNKELTIFVYVQTPWDTYDKIKNLLNVNLGYNCKLILYTYENITSNNKNIIVNYINPVNIEDKCNFHYKNDIMIDHNIFDKIVNNLKNYLKENNIEYHT